MSNVVVMKAQNRYKVALNTKFYRVKAKPWSRLVALTNKCGLSAETRTSILSTLSRSEAAMETSGSMSASVTPIESHNSQDSKWIMFSFNYIIWQTFGIKSIIILNIESNKILFFVNKRTIDRLVFRAVIRAVIRAEDKRCLLKEPELATEWADPSKNMW